MLKVQNGETTVFSPIDGRPFLIDFRYPVLQRKKPAILFIHGFKGFKDWGYFNLFADRMCAEGFNFVKMNFSRNGTTPEQPLEFMDLDGFASNNFTVELADAGKVIDELLQGNLIPENEVDFNQLIVIGHSRGGSLSIIKAFQDQRISKLITLAAVSDFTARYTHQQLIEWEKTGVIYEYNARTGQQMPLFYQLYQDFKNNPANYDITGSASGLKIPYLILHGTDDFTVPLAMAYQLNKACTQAELRIIEGADHTFGGKHPYERSELPKALNAAIEIMTGFLRN